MTQMKGNKNGAVRGANGSNCSPEAATVETTLAEAKALGTTVEEEEAAPLNGAGEKGKADVVVVTSKGSGANNGGTSTKVSSLVQPISGMMGTKVANYVLLTLL